MKKLIGIQLLTAVFLFSTIVSVAADYVSDNSIRKIRDVVLSYFSPVSGSVVDVGHGDLRIALVSGEGLRRGTRLSVFRRGEPFYHPVTGDLLGFTEELSGRIEVTALPNELDYYHCRIVVGDVRKGDIVRITSSSIKLAFFQDREAVWSISELLFSALKDTTRFEIIELYAENFELASLSERARSKGAEAVLVLSTPVIEGIRKLKVRLLWAKDANVFAEIEESVDEEIVRKERSEADLLNISLGDNKPWGNYLLVGGVLFDFGDVTGNGERELVVSDGTNLRVYSMKGIPEEVWSIKGEAHVKHLSVDVLDVNGNGKAEIFVTSLVSREREMSSFALEYDSTGGFRRVWDKAPFFLRVMEDDLLMQKYSAFGLFTGPVFKAGWEEGMYKPLVPLKLPADFNIYGFVKLKQYSAGDIIVVTLNEEGYLNLYKNGKSVWKSSDSYGPFEITLRRNKSLLFGNVGEDDDDLRSSLLGVEHVRGRLITTNTQRGEEIIIVKRFPLVKNIPHLGAGRTEIHSLIWNGAMMEEEVLLSDISGSATDYQVEDSNLYFIVPLNMTSFLKEAVGGDIMRGSKLYYYTLYER